MAPKNEQHVDFESEKKASGFAIYALQKNLRNTAAVELAVRRLAIFFERVDVLVDREELTMYQSLFEGGGALRIRAAQKSQASPLSMYREALLDLFDAEAIPDRLLLACSQTFGPIFRNGTCDFLKFENSADVIAPYWHGCDQDVRLERTAYDGRLPLIDFTIFSRRVLEHADFERFWREISIPQGHWEEHIKGCLDLGVWLRDARFHIHYPMDETVLGSSEPRFFEPGKALTHGAPCLNSGVFHLDPLIHDLNAIDVRAALDELRHIDHALYETVVQYCMRHMKLRDFCTIADQYEVIPERDIQPLRTEWGFGAYAVFIHAYYAEMMPEFWVLIQNLTGEPHLFLTAATDENALKIRQYLHDKGWSRDKFEVRVVAQNRGRDMSSLFITWRDVALSGRYEVALRLHSKKTPQVAQQVGEGFKAHLFDNLVLSKDHVSNILDLMQEQPDIGLLVPPMIHVGFGTLGHAWYNNKKPLFDLAKKMGMDVPLDDHTPVGAYGTMYWFRMEAMRKIFEHEWGWEDYNPEPHHIDGGLAHVQERLIGYCVQDSGHRVLQVMTPRHAAKNYGRLEYKTQLYAAQFASNNVMDHKAAMDGRSHSLRNIIYIRLRQTYGSFLRKYPASRDWLRPFKNATVAVLINRG